MKVMPIIPSSRDLHPKGAEGLSFELARRLEVPVWIFDIDHARIVYANDAACGLWDATDEATLCARNFADDMSPTVTKRLKQYQSDFCQSDTTFNEMWTLYPNGEPKNVMVVYRGYVMPDGRMAMQCEAVGDAQDTPQNLRSAEALLHTDVMVSLFSKDGPPLYLNPAARTAFISPITDFAELFFDPLQHDKLLDVLDQSGEYRAVTKLNTSSGPKWVDLSAKSCSDAATGQPAILSTAIDVSALKEARDKARRLANRDQLTDLHNRTYLQHYLSDLAASAFDHDCALIFLDVDRFKSINDRFGHDAGDTVLIEIAKRIKSVLRSEDLAVRLGGDEMVVLLENVSSRAEIEDRTTRLCDAISQPVWVKGTSIDVAISVGVAIFTPQDADFTEVLREADIALYASKQAGRGRWTFYTQDMGDAAKARSDLETELKAAVLNNEFILHYQPRLDIESGKIVAVEGLARWNHPTQGIIMPSVFISVCEDTGLIEELGRRVLELGCTQAIAWQRAGLDLSVSLNVSPRQFKDEGLLDTLKALSARPDFPTGKIELEITENALVGDHGMIAEKLRQITAMGYRIAIDDFGTGYSNLSYISRFPLTCLKIDRSFIDQLPSSGPIIRLILTLGQQVGATVVSEGVETMDQLDWLSKNDCDQAQGYLITPPLPPTELMSFMKRGAA